MLKKMKISDSELCHFCNETETIEHVYIECLNSSRLWTNTVAWVRDIHDPHFIISDFEKIFGSSTSNQMVNIIIISIKDVIYQKRKSGNVMEVTDVKRCILKNLCILKSRELSSQTDNTFENKWLNFIQDFKTDEKVKKSWYTI